MNFREETQTLTIDRRASETPKLCKDCAYFGVDANNVPDMCLRPAGINLVTGEPLVYDVDAFSERHISIGPSACGPEAKYFQPKS